MGYQAMEAKDYDLATKAVYLLSKSKGARNIFQWEGIDLGNTMEEARAAMVALHARFDYSPVYLTTLRGLSGFELAR